MLIELWGGPRDGATLDVDKLLDNYRIPPRGNTRTTDTVSHARYERSTDTRPNGTVIYRYTPQQPA